MKFNILNSEFSLNSCNYYLTRDFIASTRAFNLATRAFNLTTRAFSLATRAFSLLTRGFELVTREFELVIRGFEVVTLEFELITRGSELVTCAFELVTCGFELATRGFELVTRNLCFTFPRLRRLSNHVTYVSIIYFTKFKPESQKNKAQKCNTIYQRKKVKDQYFWKTSFWLLKLVIRQIRVICECVICVMRNM